MTIAGGLALIMIGAILHYAVTWESTWIDVQMVGTILMIGGAIGTLTGIILTTLRRRDRAAAEVHEERYYREPPR
ncbi:hypothetical protein GCM10009839_18600 [Catenulispora yoronensis]|uniref:Uncharacterized protein n=1 Tax=Catenulispora yoronensis TaxID=450799 RepID=A0ABN2TW98_9ACTN